MAGLANILIVITLLCHQVAAIPIDSNLISSIQKVQKQHSGKNVNIAENSVRIAAAEEPSSVVSLKKTEKNEGETKIKDVVVDEAERLRQHKMLGFYGYVPAFAPIPTFYPIPPFATSNELYGDYSSYIPYPNYNSNGPTGPSGVDMAEGEMSEDDDEAMSRANQKKRPSQFKNSPIYYIRLPPTPYMFVPGLGYISQPPTIQPLAPVMPPPPPPPPAVPMSPFYNVPINFVSNGKPTGIYQWPGTMPSAAPPVHYPAYPAHRPQRPYRPTYAQQRPTGPAGNNFAPPQPDSKITNLKGSYLFNGRPEEIYLLPQNPYTASYYPDPYSYQNYQQGYSGYY